MAISEGFPGSRWTTWYSYYSLYNDTNLFIWLRLQNLLLDSNKRCITSVLYTKPVKMPINYPPFQQVPIQDRQLILLLFLSGLSLVLKKEGLWLTKMDTQPERTLRWATHRRQELIHTSCRSESSNISLVVLDKEPICGHCISIFDLHLTTRTNGSSDRPMAIAKSKFGLGLTLRKHLI